MDSGLQGRKDPGELEVGRAGEGVGSVAEVGGASEQRSDCRRWESEEDERGGFDGCRC